MGMAPLNTNALAVDTKVYEGTFTTNYEAGYTGQFVKVWEKAYEGQFTAQYQSNWLGTAYSKTWTGSTVQSAVETISTLKLWVRTA